MVLKMDDAQTGHHTMNAILQLDNIERIEIIKGAAARVFGQNAFTGAINIVTKSPNKSELNLRTLYGSFNTKEIAATLQEPFKKGGIIASVNFQNSDGYRYNTDFENINGFFKTVKNNYQLISSFSQRKFGANGFYASPSYTDQYEETQTSLVALQSKYNFKNITLIPRIFWRRNQDMYLFLRDNPLFLRNFHITNNLGVETNAVITSKYGETGLGFSLSRVYMQSSNLGNRQRTSATIFLEHKMELLNQLLDVTPGIALSAYSNFNSDVVPGIDIGYKLNNFLKLYSNVGYTYRVPTFTDLFYVGPTTIGNADLQPESAFSQEIGIKFNNAVIGIQASFFNRNAKNLIDWTKDSLDDKWETRNFSKVVTYGLETEMNLNFVLTQNKQQIKLSYTFIKDDIKDTNVQFTRYSLNSLKHQFTGAFRLKFSQNWQQNFDLRYTERADGTKYTVVDLSSIFMFGKKWQVKFAANNIFNAEYTETNLVPMPKGHTSIGINYIVY
jgi:iron complex outermembrane receptor protein